MESILYYHTYSAFPALLLFHVSFADWLAGVLWLSFKFSSLEKGRLPLSFCCPRLVQGKTRSSILACGRAMPMSGILFVLPCDFGNALTNQRFLTVIQLPAEPFDHSHLGDPDGFCDFPLADIGDSHLVSQIFVAHFLHLYLDISASNII